MRLRNEGRRCIAIAEKELTDGLLRARTGVVIAVIDACRNNLFSSSLHYGVGIERGRRYVAELRVHADV
jgi:hypothetical protein